MLLRPWARPAFEDVATKPGGRMCEKERNATVAPSRSMTAGFHAASLSAPAPAWPIFRSSRRRDRVRKRVRPVVEHVVVAEREQVESRRGQSLDAARDRP